MIFHSGREKVITNMSYLNIPIIGATISFLGFIVTLYKVYDEQKKYHKLKHNQEKRLEYKLRIHEILLREILPIDMILSRLQDQSPLNSIDSIEIRKSIYEMLVEKNIVSFDDGSYTVDTITMEENDEEE